MNNKARNNGNYADHFLKTRTLIVDVLLPALNFFCQSPSSLRNQSSEAALQRCSYKNMFCKYAVNLQENTHAKV